MAETNTYGSRDKNQFILKDIPGKTKYYLLIDSKTGEITIKSPIITGSLLGESADRTVGKISNTGEFKPELGFITTDESKHFSVPSNINSVRNQGIITARKAGAINPEKLIFPNRTNIPPQNPPQSGNPTGSSSNPPGSSEPGGNTPPTPPSDLEVTFDTNYKTDLRVEKSLFEGKILRYPIDIASTEQDVISFTACEINPRTPKNLGTDNKVNLEFNFGEKTYTKASGSVFLSIQAPISDQNSVEWGGDNVNPIDAALYGASLNFMGAQFEEFGQYIQGYTKSTFDALKGESKRFQKYLAGQAANINNVLARTDNVILNPNMELLFNGPQLRPFSFTFKMSARKQEEATEIKNIIKFFKFHMAVRKEVNSLFIRAPYVFKIKYEQRKGNQNTIHSGLNLIKMCALTNFSVDYTPLGSYATYRDGTMVAYNMTMQFQELTPVYNDDYTDFEYGDGEKISNPIIGP